MTFKYAASFRFCFLSTVVGAQALTSQDQQAICRQALETLERYSPEETPRSFLKTMEKLEAVVQANPRQAEAYALIGRINSNLGYPASEVKKYTDQALAIDPQNKTAILTMGHLLLEAKRPRVGAKALLGKVQSQWPRDISVLILSAPRSPKLSTGIPMRCVRSKTALTITLKLFYVPRLLQDATGLALSPDDLRELKIPFERAPSRRQPHPDYVMLKGNYGYFLSINGEYDEAIHWLKKALAQMDYGAARNALAAAYNGKGWVLLYKQNRAQEARDNFQLAIRYFPPYYEAYYNLARAEAALGHHDAWEQDLKKALEIKPDYERARQELDAR